MKISAQNRRKRKINGRKNEQGLHAPVEDVGQCLRLKLNLRRGLVKLGIPQHLCVQRLLANQRKTGRHHSVRATSINKPIKITKNKNKRGYDKRDLIIKKGKRGFLLLSVFFLLLLLSFFPFSFSPGFIHYFLLDLSICRKDLFVTSVQCDAVRSLPSPK